jgi:hypothetical protein
VFWLAFQCVHADLLQCLKRFDERDARTCLDVVSDMAESPLQFLAPYVVVTAKAMCAVRYNN